MKKISRRQVLAAGAATAGILTGSSIIISAPEDKKSDKFGNPFLNPWSPPEDLKRDLTPGNTPIRLAGWMSKTMLEYRKDMNITEAVKRVRDEGFTSTNASVGMFRRNGWLDASESEVKELQAALKQYDVTFFDMHAYANNIHPDLDTRKKIHAHVIEQMEAAERLGIPMVTTQTGSCSPVSAVSVHKDNWTMTTWKLSVKVIKQLLNDTSGMKVCFGMEALNLININNPRAHRQFMDDVADPRCKVCYDPTNQISLGTYNRTTELINEGFDLLADDIMACHAKDCLVTPDKMSAFLNEVTPGTGVQDYETYLTRISRLKKPVTLIIEHIPDTEVPKAKKFIEETGKRLGVKFWG